MQVKKFEAPTIQEALDHIKRELGPEAIILQTKKHKRGFGLMSKSSVEITAAVSERALQKKKFLETRLPEDRRTGIDRLPAEKQAAIYNQYADRYLENSASGTRDRVELKGKPAGTMGNGLNGAGAVSGGAASARPQRYAEMVDEHVPQAPAAPSVRVTSTPYVDIPDEPGTQPVRNAIQQAAKLSPKIAMEKVGLEDELKHLKRMIQEMKSEQERHSQESLQTGGEKRSAGSSSIFQNEVLEDAFDQLILNGMDRRLAASLIRQVGFELGETRSKDPEQVLDQVASEIMANSEIASLLGGVKSREAAGAEAQNAAKNAAKNVAQTGPAIIALIGPTGVGKTTTVAKIASDAVRNRGLKVGLINLDTQKPAAAEQLGTYARLLNIPYRSVCTPDELSAATADFQSLDLVLIDTAGRSHKDPATIQELQSLLRSVPGVSSQLVLCSNTRDQELYEAAARFAPLRPNGLILSKLDEASIYGSIYNVSQKARLPLVYFTTGQRVPDDLEEATRERVAALVMDL